MFINIQDFFKIKPSESKKKKAHFSLKRRNYGNAQMTFKLNEANEKKSKEKENRKVKEKESHVYLRHGDIELKIELQ